MIRRLFSTVLTLLGLLVLAGCAGLAPQPSAQIETGLTPTLAAIATLPPSCVAPLPPTASDMEGPYYSPGAPESANLLEPDMTGTRLVLTGQILTTDCQPVAGAMLDFWQADASGAYDNQGYRLRGTQVSDDAGRYRLETVVPGLYPGRPAHIHVKITPPGGDTLITQIYFAGMSQGTDATQIATLEDAGDGSQKAVFDLVIVR